MIKKIIQYISYDIWFKKEHEYRSSKIRWAVRQFKVCLFTAQGFSEHSILIKSAALTFYTLMSIVPIAALMFGIAKGFALETKLSAYLYSEFPQYRIVIDQVIEFANAMLQRTKGGLIASVGLLVLFWSVIKVFNNVEKAFNDIWEVRKSRSIARKVSDYIAVVVIVPILWIISNSVRLQLQDQLLHITPGPAIEFFFSLFSLFTIWVMFAFLYMVIPNTKVKPRSAMTAGIIAGSIFQLFQIIYVNIQSSLTSYNAIYGSFAAFPLFLIWLQASWQIVLFGGELAFAYQNIKKFEYEKRASEMSYEYRKRALLLVMRQIVFHFLDNKGGISSDQVAQQLNMPVRIVRDVTFDLERAGLIAAILGRDDKTNFYIPARDVHTLTVFDVIHLVATAPPAARNRHHKNDQERWKDPLDIGMNSEYREIDTILNNMDQMAENSPYNVRIMDLKEGMIDTIAAATQTAPSVPDDSEGTANKKVTSSSSECSTAVASKHQKTKDLTTDAVTTESKKEEANSDSSKSTAKAATLQRVEACDNNSKIQA